MRQTLLALLLAGTAGLAHATPVAQIVDRPQFKAAEAALRADHDRMVQQNIALTEIPAPPFGEQARGLTYAGLMKQSGLKDVTIDAIGNVIGVRPGTDRSLPPLVVASHLDTVFPAGTDVKVRREGTRLLAPGIGDDSRGLAVLLAFVRAMDKAGIRTERDILFVGDVGEEGRGDLRGTRYLFSHNPAAQHAAAFITVDSTGAGRISTVGVGSKRYHMVFDGPGGHSYDAFGIVNPLAALADTVTGLYALKTSTDPKTTYAAGVVGGGVSVNAIPSRVFLDVDLRSSSQAALTDLDAKLHRIAEDAVRRENAARDTSRGAVKVAFEVIGDRPAGSTPETAPLVIGAADAARAYGYPVKFIAVSTDANVPMMLGIPAIAIGSGGSGGHEHAPDEFVDAEINNSVRGMSVGLATILSAADLAN